MGDRKYQLIVFGATGFTGRLVCEHIARDYQGKFAWAMAGRSLDKLGQVREELRHFSDACKDVPLLRADSADEASLNAMVAQTTVVLNMVGPFSRYGTPVVKACVKNHTHYCDITGETPWVKRMIEAFHEEAADTGTKIVHCCGFDSVPFDMGTYFVVDTIRRRLNKWCSKVEAVMGEASGGVSGGTIESLLHIMTEEGGEMRKAASEAYYLNSCDRRSGPDHPEVARPRYQHVLHQWTGPSIMAFCNCAIVRRSAELLAGMYGEQGQPARFSYRESQAMSNSLSAAAYSTLYASGQACLALLPGPLLAWMRSWLPQPGQGPSREQRERGHFRLKLVGHVRDGGEQAPVVAEMGDNRDPGYWSTSRMALECALCLGLEAERLAEQPGLAAGGVLTPASAFGRVLLERLQAAGYIFRILSPRSLAEQPAGRPQEPAAPQVPAEGGDVQAYKEAVHGGTAASGAGEAAVAGGVKSAGGSPSKHDAASWEMVGKEGAGSAASGAGSHQS